jgi:hypothetical protein
MCMLKFSVFLNETSKVTKSHSKLKPPANVFVFGTERKLKLVPEFVVPLRWCVDVDSSQCVFAV